MMHQKLFSMRTSDFSILIGSSNCGSPREGNGLSAINVARTCLKPRGRWEDAPRDPCSRKRCWHAWNACLSLKKSGTAVGTPRLLRPMLLGILLTPLGIGMDGLTLELPGVAMVHHSNGCYNKSIVLLWSPHRLAEKRVHRLAEKWSLSSSSAVVNTMWLAVRLRGPCKAERRCSDLIQYCCYVIVAAIASDRHALLPTAGAMLSYLP